MKNLASLQKCIVEAEARFFKMFAIMQNPACIISLPEEKVVNANYRFIQTFRYSLNELLDKTLEELQILDNRKQYAEAKRRIMAQGYLREYVSSLRSSQGHVLTARLFVDYIVIKGRKFLLLQLANVGEQQAVDTTQPQIASLLEQMNDGYIKLDRSLNILNINKESERMLGRPREELIGKNIAVEFPLEPHSQICKAAIKARTENVNTVVEDYLPTIGKWAETRFYPSADSIAVFFRDINDRKKEEAKLRRSRQQFKTLVENSLDVIVRLDREFRFFYVSPAIKLLTDIPEDYFTGKTWDDFNIAREYSENFRKHCNQVFSTGKGEVFETEIPTIRGIRQCHIHAAPEFSDDGSIEYVLAIIRDVTEIKQMEKEMARLDRLNLVGEMAASIGHEVRNPMTTVRGFLQMLSTKPDLDKYRGFFSLMIEELDRANSIITEYLSLAKNKAIDAKMANLNRVIRTVLPLMEADALRMNKSIIANFADVPDLLLDEKEIRQCVLNLVRNGLEAMSEGGTITISTYREEEAVVLAIKDEGSGISPEMLDKLGTPFLTTKDTGTGLGLPVCYSIAKRHNAHISVETGKSGTTFFIRFCHGGGSPDTNITSTTSDVNFP